MNEASALSDQLHKETVTLNQPRSLRLRFPLVCLLVFWFASFAMGVFDKPYFIGFLFGLATTTLLTLVFLGWWMLNRGLRAWEKLLGLVIIVGEAWLVGRYSHHSINYFSLWVSGVPLAATAVVAWLILVRRFQISSARLGFVVVVSLVWGYFLLIRDGGVDSRLKVARHWRWTPTSEQQFLSKSNASSASPNTDDLLMAKASAGDWTCFRGTNRDGVIHATVIATNWSLHPPVQIWKHAVGPAWSSLLVVGNRIFTQEQRGENESIVCYDATTGHEVWVHTDTARFEESVSGPGPRATPTFADGKLYALGGTGILNCLETTRGKTLWNRDIKEASKATVPTWGFSSSPLVTDGLVVVYAGGEAGKGLLAYRLESGDLAWAAPAGTSSYSSPQLTMIDSVPQCLMLHDGGLSAVEIISGTKLWETGLAMKGAPRCGQPRLIEDNKLLVGTLGLVGCSLIEVSKGADKWTISKRWKSRDLKPEFPDFVVHRGYAYGFDLGIFCCIKVADGKRSWKDGRYGRGQVMLLADQDALLVTSETGELVLLAADSKERRELGKFQALDGKTWNHPVVRGDRVYLRNAEQIGCFAISEKSVNLGSIQN